LSFIFIKTLKEISAFAYGATGIIGLISYLLGSLLECLAIDEYIYLDCTMRMNLLRLGCLADPHLRRSPELLRRVNKNEVPEHGVLLCVRRLSVHSELFAIDSLEIRE
jgi:hypothetical protein